MGRWAKLAVAVGRKSSGKSYTTEKMIWQYVQGNPVNGIATIPPRRVLIIDVNDEYSNIKAIRVEDVALFSVHPIIEVRRIRPYLPDGRKMTLDDVAAALLVILDTFHNGLLLVEDINKYVSDAMPNDLVGALCTNRHSGVDIVLHYQSIGRVSTKVWQNINLLRLHKFTDTVLRHKKKFEDKFEYLSVAEILVNTQYENGNKYFFLYVDIDEEKVFGAFSKNDFEAAVTKFIQINYTSLIAPLLKARTETGGKVHTPMTAMTEVKARLMSYYRHPSPKTA